MIPLKGFLAFAILASAMAWAPPAYGRPRAVDLQHSKMTVYVYKQGAFSFLADNHEVNAPLLSGSYDGETKTVELTVDAAKMRVLDPKLPAQKRDSVQTNMAGPQVLDVARYPTISFHSTKIDDSNPNGWTVTGDLTLHGQTHPVTFQVRKVDAARFTGSATIRQTTFGITPIRIAGGAVSVRDDVEVKFEIALAP
jgi:polyisoprenoid-binding protein YceI